ncbi:MAG: VTT domain-containing protein [Desulfovermiculus sp.]
MIDVSALLDLISQHTVLACIGITLIAALECLALVGLFLPGTMLIFFFGTLAGSGILPAGAVLGCTFAGAFLGDACSYWLGRRFHLQIKGLPFFRNQTSLFRRGEDFFHRHGGKGLILGRFVGPLRPVVPLIAGMMDMGGYRFVAIALCSCLTWTVIYLLPGMFFGSSLVVVAQISGRLTAVILLCTALLLSTAWAFRFCARMLEMLGFLWMNSVGKWLNTRPASKKMAHALRQFVQPTIRPYRELEGLGAFLLVFSLCMFVIFVLAFHPGTNWHKAFGNQSLAHFFLSLHTFWTLHALMFFSALGSKMVLFSCVGVLILFLALSRHPSSAGYLAAAVVGSQFLALGMQGGPAGIFPWADQVFSASNMIISPALWPSVYAFPAILAYSRYHYRHWWVVFWVMFCITCLIGMADLWLGRWTLPQIVYGLSLGWGWTALLGFAYIQNPEKDLPVLSSLLLWTIALLLVLPWQARQIQQAYPETLTYNRPVMRYEAWQDHGWQEFPVYREDMQGQPKQPLNIQFFGNITGLLQNLEESGWEQAPGFSIPRMLAHFSPESRIEDLMVLPSLHKGCPETLRMNRGSENGRLVLRLWQAGHLHKGQDETLYEGMVSKQVRKEYLKLFSLAVNAGQYGSALAKLQEDLGHEYTRKYALRPTSRGRIWDGRVLLVQNRTKPSPVSLSLHTDETVPAGSGD